VSQGRVPLSQPKVRKILDTTPAAEEVERLKRQFSRVGLRRGSGFDDADVSSIPPIIPYGGFSPIRLQG
jgi:hypothetical protein